MRFNLFLFASKNLNEILMLVRCILQLGAPDLIWLEKKKIALKRIIIFFFIPSAQQ